MEEITMSGNLARVLPINQDVAESALEQKTLSLYEQAISLKINDEQTYIEAAEVGKTLKVLEKEITEFYEPMRLTAKAAYDAILSSKNAQLAPVTEAMGIVRSTLNVYVQEQDRIKKEAERKAQLAADEAAKKERERLEAQALKAMEAGKEEKMESLLEKAENVYAAPVQVAPVIEKTVATSAGNITQAKEIKITVTNVALFLQELIAKHPGALANIVKIGDGPLKAFIKSNGMTKYPGLHIEQTVGVRF
jgi:hypothetical protein